MSGLNMVSWRDYEGVDGFGGSSSADELQTLQKALAAGNDINAGAMGAGDGFALRVESLEKALHSTTYRMEHPRLWRLIPKRAAYNTVEEFNQVTSFGDLSQGAWVSEGELPVETDATYKRQYAKVKFLATLRRVTHVMTLVKPAHGNVIAQEVLAGTMYLIRQLERNLFIGDSSLDPDQWDGLDKLITDGAPAANIVDLRGQPLSEDVLVDGALTVQNAPNYGTPTHLFCNPQVKADLVKTFFPKARYDLFGKGDNGMVGLDISGFMSPAGGVKFESDVFVEQTAGLPAGASSDSGRPGSPTISTPGAAASEAGSLFGADDEGDYHYYVVAVNRRGHSAPVAVTGGGAISVAEGDGVTIGVTPAAGNETTYFELYRSAPGGSQASCKLIQRVAAAGGAQDIVDLNETLPGTSNAYLLQCDSENLAFAQLAPMMKIALGTFDATLRWMQMIYGTPLLYTPGRNVIYRNVGNAPSA